MSQNSFVVLNSGGGEETENNQPNSVWALVEGGDDGSATVNAFDGLKKQVDKEEEEEESDKVGEHPDEGDFDNCSSQEEGKPTVAPSPCPAPVDSTLHIVRLPPLLEGGEEQKEQRLPPLVGNEEQQTSKADAEAATQRRDADEAAIASMKKSEEIAAREVKRLSEARHSSVIEKKLQADQVEAAAEAAQRLLSRQLVEAKAQRERDEHAARVQGEEAESQLKMLQQVADQRKWEEQQWQAECQKERTNLMKSEEEARFGAIAELHQGKEELLHKWELSKWRAEQDAQERSEIEAISLAADAASRQRLSDAKVAEMENERVDRKCQCLGASSGVHRRGCPEN